MAFARLWRLAPLILPILLFAFALPTGDILAQDEWDVTQARGETREIDFTTDEGTWLSVDISPDGGWIVFDLLGHIYRISAQGGDAERLTQASRVAVNYH
ncbi:MAG: hypothetical protein HKO53_11155, partial [Gemmatimonadetes bacterium]|nr:hypothetical protein [Gemmatimonadota bacterium]